MRSAAPPCRAARTRLPRETLVSARVGSATNGSLKTERSPAETETLWFGSRAVGRQTDWLGAPGAGSIAVAFATLLSCAPVVLNGLDVPMVFAFVCSVKVVASPTWGQRSDAHSSTQLRVHGTARRGAQQQA